MQLRCRLPGSWIFDVPAADTYNLANVFKLARSTHFQVYNPRRSLTRLLNGTSCISANFSNGALSTSALCHTLGGEGGDGGTGSHSSYGAVNGIITGIVFAILALSK